MLASAVSLLQRNISRYVVKNLRMNAPLPQVTMVMPVYNALPYLDPAIESVLAQTLGDFRLAIHDDGSTDGSFERALDWAARDPRIRVQRGERRLGPSGSSAAAAALADTEFVARMDADDICAPDRLAYQLAAMRANPDAVLIGSTFEMIDGHGRVIRGPVIGALTGFAPPIAHSSIFYRREAFLAAGGYREQTNYFEDQDLYRRLALHGRLLVTRRPLMQVRFAGQHARLRDNREEVLEGINRLYRHDAASQSIARRNISPVAFYAVGVLAVLNLDRPRLLGLMLMRADFAQPLKALGMITFIALAELSPRAARSVNQFVGWLRKVRSSKEGVREIETWSFAAP